MKTKFTFLVLMTFLSFSGFSQERIKSKATFEDKSTSESKTLIESNSSNADFVILDVRRKTEYNEGHIKNAMQLDFYATDFDSKLNLLNKSKTYLVYCRTGNRSSQTLDKMKNMSFTTAYNMLGGITQWKTDNYPVASATNKVGEDISTTVANAMIKQHSQDNNFVLLDVRTSSEFQTEHIHSAINLDFNSSSFDSDLQNLDKNKQYLVYCRTGNKSKQTINKMLNNDFIESYSMLGGITQWISDGLPTDKTVEFCQSKGQDASSEWIEKVEFDTFIKTSGTNSGYADFTSETIDLEAGAIINIKLSPGFSSSSYDEYWKIWIDLNNDGDFEDVNENIFDAGSVSKSAVTGTFTIPEGTAAITSRLRVTMKYVNPNSSTTGNQNPPEACEVFPYGEVEDYTVQITNSTVDDLPPSIPTDLSILSVTATSVSMSWTASTDNVGVSSYDIYKDGVLETNVTNTSATITGLTANRVYDFTVRAKDEAGNVSDFSDVLKVTTPDVNDCISTYPYSESFENGMGGFYQDDTDDIDWIRQTGSTPSSNTGASEAFAGEYFMYVNASSPNYPGKVAGLISPCYDLSTLRTPKLDFMYHMYGTGMGKLDIQAKTPDSAWETVRTISGNQGDSWAKATVILKSYAGLPSVKIRFRGTTGSNYTSDICIDSLSIECGANAVDTIAPSTPANLVVSDVTQTSALLSWEASTDNFGVTGYEVYRNNNLVTIVTSTSYTDTALNNHTKYNFFIKAKDAAGNTSESSNEETIITLAPPYCTSKGGSQQYEWISRVELNHHFKESGASPYTDFTDSLKIRVTPGYKDPIKLIPGFSGQSYNEYWTFWVDYNNDGDFDDANEKIYSKSSSSTVNDSVMFIPANITGYFRLRVVMSYDNNTGSCESYRYGETEDYTIWCGCGEWQEKGESQPLASNIEFSYYPNPASQYVNLLINSSTNSNAEVKLYSITGKLMYTEKLKTIEGKTAKKIFFGDIPKGMYILNISNGEISKSERLLIK